MSIKRKQNPVLELPMSKAEIARITASIDRQLSGRGANLRKAAALYGKFTGHENLSMIKMQVPAMPHELVEIGKIDALWYTTVRDGITERYKHDFKKNSRPLFAVSPDGKQLILLGGAFTFGERGIVDE